jgi:hypothetical protein
MHLNISQNTQGVSSTSTELGIGLHVDKVSSSVARLVTEPFVCVEDTLAPTVGDVVAVKVCMDSPNGNVLELGCGRMATVNNGDIIVGVLGKRRALKGFVGYVPEKLVKGDLLNILNLGGVIGKVTGKFHELKMPTQVEYLGTVMNEGTPLNIAKGSLSPKDSLEISIPLVLTAGTCMQSGKTRAAAELVKQFTRDGYKVCAAKLTGIACLRDTLFMEDYGAVETLSFLDCGYPSTVDLFDIAPITKAIIEKLGEESPDVIVIELGDGLMGYYNVESLFHDKEIMRSSAATVLCANDFVGAWGGIEFLKGKGIHVDVVCGSATDSNMAVEYIESKFQTSAANALNDSETLFSLVKEKVESWKTQKNLN